MKEVKKMCETAILVALAVVVEFLFSFLPQLPAGGRVSLSCLFIALIGFKNGYKYGFIGCICFALCNFLIDGAVWYGVVSLILDYFVAFGLFGATGFFTKAIKEKKLWLFIAVFSACYFGRFLASTISGMIAFDTALWDSILYNGSYCLPSLALCLVIGIAIYKPMCKLFNKEDLVVEDNTDTETSESSDKSNE